MRDLLHPVLLGLLVTAIGVVAHRGGRAAAKHAGRLHADEEDPAGKAADREELVGKETPGERAIGKGAASEGAPREIGDERHGTATAAGKPADGWLASE